MTYRDMIESNDSDIFADQYCLQVINSIKEIMNKKNISQGQLATNSGIGQSTISKFLSGDTKMSLIHIAKICKALKVCPEEILALDPSSGEISSDERSQPEETSFFIKNPDHLAYKGYKNSYHVYFNSTVSSETELRHGILYLDSSDANTSCLASLKLYTGQISETGEQIVKYYTGQMYISLSMASCYCILFSKDIGELCFFVFHHMFLLNANLVCRMACAVTTSSGENRRPTMHRLLISRLKLDIDDHSGKDFNFIKSQLKLNNSDIILSKTAYEELLKKEEETISSEEMQQLILEFERNRHIEEFYTIDEGKIRSLKAEKQKKIELISLLREYSISDKYNKISTKTDEYIFEYITNKEKKASEKTAPKKQAAEETGN